METTKLVSKQTRVERANAFAKTTYTFAYAFFMTMPVLGFFLGMGVFAFVAFNIYRLSAQRKTDVFWLIFGSILSVAGFVIEIAMMETIPPIGGWAGAMIDFGINLFVAIFILGGRIGHLLFGSPTKR
ncbi:hypothetical protein [Burkholderia glumae]|uniref:hypothetical protein n=1 Tax=Burkholderia glumae TaxID=337 RepID=UPI002036D974|nr:hypothetical protein [Burkholderia glumae]MCM2538716.1 hypothetical protein [Burkholderia glumae]